MTDYLPGGCILRSHSDTIKATNIKIDILFFAKHFGYPYNLPENFTNINYKNERVEIRETNWKKTLSFDSLSRLINFTYSGCPTCDNMPYDYSVTYNLLGQVEKITNLTFGRDSYKVYYDTNSNINQMHYLSAGDMLKQILVIQ